jgi:hypothetical protein
MKPRVHWIMVAWLTLGLGPGCTATRLRDRTVNQAMTLTDLQYQQVQNNLAMLCFNPEAVPSQINLRDGSAQLADAASVTAGDTNFFFGSRTAVEQWGMTPVTD